MTTVARKGKTIILEFPEEFDAQNVAAALEHQQWMRLKGGNIVLAREEPEPKMTDHERLVNGSSAPIYPIPDGKNPAPVQRSPAVPDRETHDPSCFVQHIGAGLRDTAYARSYARMVSVGFILLRSPRGLDNKYWEVWYLPGMFFLKGELAGEKDRQKLVRWLFNAVAPGNVNFLGEGWALTWD